MVEIPFRKSRIQQFRNPRKNENSTNPPTIEIKVYHFSGVLAAQSAGTGEGVSGVKGGGCYIGIFQVD